MKTGKNQFLNRESVLRLFSGVLVLLFMQSVFLIVSFLLNGEFKEGLISAGMLLAEGIQTWPVQIALLRYFTVSVFLLFVIAAISFLSSRFVSMLFGDSVTERNVFLLILLAFYVALIVVNIYLFPNTNARVEYFSALSDRGDNWPLWIALAVLLIIHISAFWALVKNFKTRLADKEKSPVRRPVLLVFIALATFIVFSFSDNFWSDSSLSKQHAISRPNIILIGLDSVRPDVLESKDLAHQYMPNLVSFLTGPATSWFSHAYVPIARTFAAWYSALSGQSPASSGVRYNLQHLTTEQKEATVVPALRDAGYLTIYGSDEKRFSVIDESYGFEEILGPPAGVAEWLLSALEDSPVHNLIRLTPISAYLFPYTHSNRASINTYSPDNFIAEVRSKLRSRDKSRPLFLALHFCLAHWPYTWREGVEQKSSLLLYFDAIHALDVQFAQTMGALNELGILDNAVLFVFSDHGESFTVSQHAEMTEDESIILNELSLMPDRIAGHGTSLRSLSQNRIFIGSKDYRSDSRSGGGKVDHVTSIQDIAKTVASLVGLQFDEIDGLDLQALSSSLEDRRPIFLETGFNLPALYESTIDIEKIVEQGIEAYEVSPDGHLQIRPAHHKKIVQNKQTGVTDGRILITDIVWGSERDLTPISYRKIDVGSNVETVVKDIGSISEEEAWLLQAYTREYRNELMTR